MSEQMPGVYTYVFCDLRTGVVLDVLPLKQVSFTTRLNQAGRLTAYADAADAAVQVADPVALTRPGRTAMYVDRDGSLLWGGIVWKSNYKSIAKTIDLDVQDFQSYLARRILYASKAYVAADPLTIAQDLVAYTKTLAGGDIGINVVAPAASGQVLSMQWDPWDLKVIGEAIADLAASAVGFEWGIDVAWSSGVPAITLTLSYPRRGRRAPDTGLVWEYPPGNVDNYELSEDATEMVVTAYEAGSGSGPTMALTNASTPGLLDDGYPLLEAVFAHKDQDNLDTLGQFARADASAHAGPTAFMTLSVRAELDPVLGAYTTGDDCRVRITDQRFPAPADGSVGLDTYYRIQEIAVTPQDDQEESVALTLGPVLP